MKFVAAIAFLMLSLAHADRKNEMDSNGRELYTQRNLELDEAYPYTKNYVTIIDPENFQFDLAGGGDVKTLVDLSIVGSTFVQNGKVYDPADVQIVNKFNGVERNDPLPNGVDFQRDIIETGLKDKLKYAGNRQPKDPVPDGDDAYFFHGICTATSGIDSTFSVSESFIITSHTCQLNLCLGGGGFDCIAILAGSSFVFDLGKQIGLSGDGVQSDSDVSLPPPYPGTIIGGTGSFEGIEGTVDIATIAGSTGIELFEADNGLTSVFNIGKIVQTISVHSNHPLPSAP